MNQSLIWGTILILLGISLLLKSLFRITIPLVRPFLGCVMIYLGLTIMMDPFHQTADKRTVIFAKSNLVAQDQVRIYNTTFGASKVDLTTLQHSNEPQHVTINTVLGATEIILDPAVATKITVNAICARAELPDETLVSFGRNIYRSQDAQEPQLIVHINAVLANVNVTFKPQSAAISAASVEETTEKVAKA
jgi:predicted membrane protein